MQLGAALLLLGASITAPPGDAADTAEQSSPAEEAAPDRNGPVLTFIPETVRGPDFQPGDTRPPPPDPLWQALPWISALAALVAIAAFIAWRRFRRRD